MVNNTSFSKEENIVFRPIKHRFLKPHLVQQRYNIGIAVIKYFGNYFSGGGIFHQVLICCNISNIEKAVANK